MAYGLNLWFVWSLSLVTTFETKQSLKAVCGPCMPFSGLKWQMVRGSISWFTESREKFESQGSHRCKFDLLSSKFLLRPLKRKHRQPGFRTLILEGALVCILR